MEVARASVLTDPVRATRGATAHRRWSNIKLLHRSARDPDAFGAFYDRHATSVLAYFHRRTACLESAADLTAETFAAAFLARRRFRDTGAPAAAWLFAIARRQLANLLRKRRSRIEPAKSSGSSGSRSTITRSSGSEDLADLTPLVERLEEAIAGLGPGSLEAVRLRIDEELPYSEVARRLGGSEGAARVRVARALSKLADALEVTR